MAHRSLRTLPPRALSGCGSLAFRHRSVFALTHQPSHFALVHARPAVDDEDPDTSPFLLHSVPEGFTSVQKSKRLRRIASDCGVMACMMDPRDIQSPKSCDAHDGTGRVATSAEGEGGQPRYFAPPNLAQENIKITHVFGPEFCVVAALKRWANHTTGEELVELPLGPFVASMVADEDLAYKRKTREKRGRVRVVEFAEPPGVQVIRAEGGQLLDTRRWADWRAWNDVTYGVCSSKPSLFGIHVLVTIFLRLRACRMSFVFCAKVSACLVVASIPEPCQTPCTGILSYL